MKRILIVSPYFAPENSIASVRFTKIGKYLKLMGHDVSVLCTQMNVNMVVDKTLEKEIPLFDRIIRVNHSKLLYYAVKSRFGVENQNSVNNSIDSTKNESKIKETIVWCYFHFCSILLGHKYIRYIKKNKNKYDVVITTFGPISAHILGNYMKRKKMTSTWIADFRDTLTALCDRSLVSLFIQNYGAHLIKNADYISIASWGAAETLIKETEQCKVDIKGKVNVISNGYDAEDRKMFRDVKTSEGKLVFAYCGTIYKFAGKVQNDITSLFEALAALIKENKIDKSKIEVKYAGKDIDLIMSFAEHCGLKDVICYHGKVSRDESIMLQRSSDIVIAAVWNNKGDHGAISGKFYETLLVQRNVLGIVTGNASGSDLAKIVGKIGCGFVYEEVNGDKSEIGKMKEWILNAYNEKMANKQVSYSCTDAGEAFSHQKLAQQFDKLF